MSCDGQVWIYFDSFQTIHHGTITANMFPSPFRIHSVISPLISNYLNVKLRTVLQKGSHFVIHFKTVFQAVQADFSICF